MQLAYFMEYGWTGRWFQTVDGVNPMVSEERRCR